MIEICKYNVSNNTYEMCGRILDDEDIKKMGKLLDKAFPPPKFLNSMEKYLNNKYGPIQEA